MSTRKKYSPEYKQEGVPRDVELATLRRELALVKRERDFLKEAAVGSIDQRNTHVKTVDCRGSLDEAHVHSTGKRVCL